MENVFENVKNLKLLHRALEGYGFMYIEDLNLQKIKLFY